MLPRIDAEPASHRRGPGEFERFVEKLHQQALESQEERWPLYLEAGLRHANLVLDVGCGPGGVTADVIDASGGTVVGVDASRDMLDKANAYLGAAPRGRNPLYAGRFRGLCADGHHLPFPDDTFDAVVCNLYLMWAHDPSLAVKEMARVTKANGVVLATLEPDFGGKIHYPEDPEVDPLFRGDAIRQRGGDPHIGRRLRALFVRAGLDTTVGIGNRRIWSPEEDRRSWERASDLYVEMLRRQGFDEDRIEAWQQRQRREFDEGVSLNFFPQFYAVGRKRAD